MQLVMLDQSRAAPSHGERASMALAGVIGCVGRADFGTAALARLSSAMMLCWWSVYSLYPDGPPRMHTSGACNADDHTVQAFETYRHGLYERDQTFLEATERTRAGGSALTHWHSREIARDHRQRIYARHGLMERVSLVSPQSDGGVLAINLYRGTAQPAFDDEDMDTFRAWGAPLLATLQLHIRSTALMAMAADAVPEPRTRNASCLDGLPRREREVCDRLLRGWTYDGIAADLQISSGTVKTYRDRAFDRLGLHHRNELFALALKDVTN